MSETRDVGHPTNGMVCEVCLNVAKHYYKTLLKVEKQIHWEYRATFKKNFNLFSTVDKRGKADWILAYEKTQDYEDNYHSQTLENDIFILLKFHDMEIEYMRETDEHVIIMEGIKYF